MAIDLGRVMQRPCATTVEVWVDSLTLADHQPETRTPAEVASEN